MPKLSIWMIRAALLHFGIGFTLAALMLANKGYFFEANLWRLLESHIYLLLFGWMLQLAMGVAYYALPRFTNQDAKYGKTYLGWISFVLLNLGISIAAISFYFSQTAPAFFGNLLMLIAAITYVRMIFPRVKPFGE